MRRSRPARTVPLRWRCPLPVQYSITEIAPPVGYTLDPATYTVEVEGHTAAGEEVAFIAKNYQTRGKAQ